MKKGFLFLLAWIIALALPASASIIKKPPAKQADLTYQELACTEQDQAYIYEIISTMAENGKLNLLFKKTHLKEIGEQINHVHPMKFMSTIFTNPHLKSCMFYIWDDYFKRNGFLDGLGPSLTREADKGKLHQYIKEFAEEVGVPVENIEGYFQAREWEGLVLYLIHS